MKSEDIIKKVIGIPFILLANFSITHASPYAIEKLPDQTVYNDFVVGPGKYEVGLKPGESRIVNLIVTNRLGKDKTFQIQTEDFTGTRDLEKTVVLLENERGPYSLKDYLIIASTTFTLGHAERATIPVTVSIPTDAQPGGLYGSVVIGTVTSPQEQVAPGQSSVGTSPIVTRIGSLFFIRVAGEVKEDLVLKKFSLKDNKWLLGSAPINFEILYENNGTVHENPSGSIRVNNIFNSEIANIEIEPWFILPDSLRVRELSLDNLFLFGRYVATAEIEKGYNDEKDIASVAFWVIPWKIILVAFIILLVLIYIVRWLMSKIKISIKK